MRVGESHRKVHDIQWNVNGKQIASGNDATITIPEIGVYTLNVKFKETESGTAHNKAIKLYVYKEVNLSAMITPNKNICGEVALGITTESSSQARPASRAAGGSGNDTTTLTQRRREQQGKTMTTQEMFINCTEMMAALNPAEMPMMQALQFVAAIAAIAQAEAAQRQADALERMADVLEDVWDPDLSTLRVSAPNGIGIKQ